MRLSEAMVRGMFMIEAGDWFLVKRVTRVALRERGLAERRDGIPATRHLTPAGEALLAGVRFARKAAKR